MIALVALLALAPTSAPLLLLLPHTLFEQRQLETVLEVCRHATTLSEAGRHLFSVSRQHKKQPNDADRLRKYLMRFGLNWEDIQKK
ncbi:hypothetical protein VH86_23235 [Pantoea sp. BL1]|nr:hypothetical protein VH86_23235 [Pantoea sp. BL1]